MQKLFFEDAWKKTISSQDRQKIRNIFDERKIGQGLSITYLWEAKNHLDDLLVTSLIHNQTGEPCNLDKIKIQYKTKIASFSLPITIPAYHSMPWTFIFDGIQADGEADYVIREED